MPPFQFDGVQFFSTWSQCGDLTREEVLSHLQSIRPLKWCRIALEPHQDGQPHIHAAGVWSKRLKTSNCRLLDIRGKHPKWEPMRSIGASLTYLNKEWEFIDYGSVPGSTSSNFNPVEASTSLSESEYFSECLKHKVPFQYAAKFLDLQKAKNATTIVESYVPDMLRETLEVQAVPFVENKTNILIGPTGVGKTQWAKRIAPKPALWVRHIDVLRSFRIGYHKSVIFDDVVFTHYPRESQIHIADVQDEAHIHVRYGVAIIPAGIPRIFTANRAVFIADEAIDRRCCITFLMGV